MFQIMVVEDDINARRLMQAVIEQNSYAAIPGVRWGGGTCADGQKAR